MHPGENTTSAQTLQDTPAPIPSPPRIGLFPNFGKRLLDRGIDFHGIAFDHFLANLSAGVNPGQTAICEFLEETALGVRLHPEALVERARHRAWIEFASVTLNSIAGLCSAPDAAASDAKRVNLAGKMARSEGTVAAGPYITGERFSLVDAAYGPVSRYFDTCEATLPPLGVFDGVPKVRAWRAVLAVRPSVQGAVAADYLERLAAFLRARRSYLSSLTA